MNPISAEIVENTWQQMAEMGDREAIKIVEKIGREQPSVLAYLMAAGGDAFNEDEREMMLYLGLVVWKIMQQGDRRLKEVSMDSLEAEEEINFKMLEDMAGESEGDLIAVTGKMLANFNQIEVLRYVVEAIMEDEEFEEDEVEMEEDSKGLMLIYLKTVINCFDTA